MFQHRKYINLIPTHLNYILISLLYWVLGLGLLTWSQPRTVRRLLYCWTHCRHGNMLGRSIHRLTVHCGVELLRGSKGCEVVLRKEEESFLCSWVLLKTFTIMSSMMDSVWSRLSAVITTQKYWAIKNNNFPSLVWIPILTASLINLWVNPVELDKTVDGSEQEQEEYYVIAASRIPDIAPHCSAGQALLTMFTCK